MKSVSATLQNAIRQAYNIYCKPRLTAEWNLNRYAGATADNVAPEATFGYAPEMFPIESIMQPNRPTRGINKARIGQAYTSSYAESPPGARYYISTVDIPYKYWTSPSPTSGSTFPTYTQSWADQFGLIATGTDSLTIARPYVAYSKVMQSNKIVIKIENSWASPASYQVLTRSTVGGAWTSVATNPAMDSLGQIVLYRQSGGTWSTTAPTAGTTAPLTSVAGVMLRVDSMNKTSSFLDVIEISARREEDLTDRLIAADSDMNVGENSVIYPIGTMNGNTANISLSNIDGIFNNEGTSTYAGICEPNVKFTLDYVYTINGTPYVVRDWTMFGGAWQGQLGDTISIECEDFFKYFQELTPAKSYYQNISASEAVWRLCDQVGFVDYDVDVDPSVSQIRIPHFWTDGEQTMSEVLDEIGRATQTAMYFDYNGRLKIKPRTMAYSSTAASVWTLKGAIDPAAPTELPDIVDMSQESEIGTNHVTVSYQATELKRNDYDDPIFETVWEPDGAMALRATPLLNNLTSSDTIVRIAGDQAEIWPYKGYFQIQGEIFEYAGKGYVANGVSRVVTSQDEKERWDSETPAGSRYANHFNGNMYVTQRGFWNSEAKAHSVDAAGYNTAGSGSFSQVKAESCARLTSTTDYFLATRGNPGDTTWRAYGCRVRFNPTGRTTQRAGIAVNMSSGNDGYFIDLQVSKYIDRATQNELRVHDRGTTNYATHGIAVVENRFYDIDVYVSPSNFIIAYINGVKVVEVQGNKTQTGKFGLVTIGSTDASFEYLYAVNRTDRELPDMGTFYDRVRRAYSSTQLDREWIFDWRATSRRERRLTGRAKERWNKMYIDEFGPYLHELRSYDVKFEPSPVMTSKPFLTNDNAAIIEYTGDSFGAQFVITNASRRNAITNGEDALTVDGSGNAVNQIFQILGWVVNQSETETVIAKNDNAISARGKIESDISSQWIQTKDSAQAVADWIKGHWGTGLDTYTATIFGNSLLELTDVVSVYYPDMNMAPATHKFFVTGISQNFDAGLETTVTLRRKL